MQAIDARIAVSKMLKDDADGQFLRELIFEHATIDWSKVGDALKNHFPEMRSEDARPKP